MRYLVPVTTNNAMQHFHSIVIRVLRDSYDYNIHAPSRRCLCRPE